MCGIVAYVGPRRGAELTTLLVGGLSRVEYRGYDSAGVAWTGDGSHPIMVVKCQGKIADLEEGLEGIENRLSGAAIGHTRWATHGDPNETNAHPHRSCRRHVAVVHNGIIENEDLIRRALRDRGHVLQSETDSELLAHLIGEFLNGDPLEAVRTALETVQGDFALAVIFRDYPDRVIFARRESPLCIGVGDGEYWVASDPASFMEHTRKIIDIGEDQLGVISASADPVIVDFGNVPVTAKIEEIDWDIEEAEKDGYEHFMLKEICRQPASLTDSMRGRLLPEGGVHLGGLLDHRDVLQDMQYCVLPAAGTSLFASMVGEILIEEIVGVPAVARNAAELANRQHLVFPRNTVFWAASQSGGTADTLSAIRRAQALGHRVFGLCNVVGSPVSRETDGGVHLHAGPEIGVASTKAFTSQVLLFQLICLYIRRLRGQEDLPWMGRYLEEMRRIPKLAAGVVAQSDLIRSLAERFYQGYPSFYFLGRGILYPVAMEGALKLKEISYLHAEGYPMAEMKHGPIALIDERFPTVVLVPQGDDHYEKIVANIREIKARKGIVIAVASQGDDRIAEIVDEVIYVPRVTYYLLPILYVIPLQLFAYHMAVLRGCNVDQPRNLAKSVTVS
ncbi:MAG: glutamine--fructose-6-phosphate transaminase (isomerizing) [bacterium]|nr:glutamine--fructose-6-phosphate transaminase (isomerizing) [bacterium]